MITRRTKLIDISFQCRFLEFEDMHFLVPEGGKVLDFITLSLSIFTVIHSADIVDFDRQLTNMYWLPISFDSKRTLWL